MELQSNDRNHNEEISHTRCLVGHGCPSVDHNCCCHICGPNQSHCDLRLRSCSTILTMHVRVKVLIPFIPSFCLHVTLVTFCPLDDELEDSMHFEHITCKVLEEFTFGIG
ncbi:hypothetical protein HanIR_Chr14g0694851 [Helianthus annuus]|nr:hypothetical protein HanIR_Chr14g0694851 [Helianthus annuus]